MSLSAEASVAPSPVPLPHLTVGNVQIGFPVVQAALSGYSDMAMRVIARRLGAAYSLREVVLDQRGQARPIVVAVKWPLPGRTQS